MLDAKNKITYFNGEYINHCDAKVHVDDRGFCFGDGVYDVTLVVESSLIDAEHHIQRFYNSLRAVNMSLTAYFGDDSYAVFKSKILEICEKLIKINDLKKGFVYFQVSRGHIGVREHTAPFTDKPTFFISVSQREINQAWIDHGIKVCTTADLRWQRRNIKTTQLYPNVLAKQKALDYGFDDAIFLDDGNAIESTSANLFVVDKDNQLWTHPLCNKILDGITRRRIILLAQEIGIKVVENSFDLEFLLSCKEVFLTNATLIIRPVVIVDNHTIGTGKVGEITKNLHNKYAAFIQSQIRL